MRLTILKNEIDDSQKWDLTIIQNARYTILKSLLINEILKNEIDDSQKWSHDDS